MIIVDVVGRMTTRMTWMRRVGVRVSVEREVGCVWGVWCLRGGLERLKKIRVLVRVRL